MKDDSSPGAKRVSDSGYAARKQREEKLDLFRISYYLILALSPMFPGLYLFFDITQLPFFLLGAFIASPVALVASILFQASAEVSLGLVDKEKAYIQLRQRNIWPWGAMVSFIGYLSILLFMFALMKWSYPVETISVYGNETAVMENDSGKPEKVKAIIGDSSFDPVKIFLAMHGGDIQKGLAWPVIFLAPLFAFRATLRRIREQEADYNG